MELFHLMMQLHLQQEFCKINFNHLLILMSLKFKLKPLLMTINTCDPAQLGSDQLRATQKTSSGISLDICSDQLGYQLRYPLRPAQLSSNPPSSLRSSALEVIQLLLMMMQTFDPAQLSSDPLRSTQNSSDHLRSALART